MTHSRPVQVLVVLSLTIRLISVSRFSLRWIQGYALLPVMLLISAWAGAGQQVDIYRADVLVESQTESERNAAARASFGELIVRVSGQRRALENPAIKRALPKAQQYLFGFTYKSTAEKLTQDGKSLPALALQLNFEPRAVDQLLREAQLPMWPATRPKLLVWLIYKDSSGLHQITQGPSARALDTQAAYRGVPLIYPHLDPEDNFSLSADALWAVDVQKIKAASARYKADAILIGRYTPTGMGAIPPPLAVAPTPTTDTAAEISSDVAASDSLIATGPWVGNWQLIHGDDQQEFTDETPEVAGLFSSALDWTADYLATRYAITPTSQGPQAIVMRINKVTNFGAFKQVQRYLDQLAMVQRKEVVSVTADSVVVRLTSGGDVKVLMSTLALDRRLAPVELPHLRGTSSPPTDGLPSEQQSADGLDGEAMAELDRALANENLSNQEPSGHEATGDFKAVAPEASAGAGTLDDPLVYVWQP